MNNSSKEYELKYLNKTIDIIKKNLDLKKDSVFNDEKEIYEINKYLWNDVSSLNSDLDYIERRFFENVSFNKHNVVLNDVRKIDKLKKAYKSAYFGRIDFNNKPIYIGITGIEDNNKYYVYDWRTQVASLYYNYGCGKASYVSNDDKVNNGEITLKRQYKINYNNLVRYFDSSLTIDDEYLQEILTETKNDKMKNIVNTIQKDQNEIIRNDKDSCLIVDGVAGSGKTSVALHHIAYLLYKNKDLSSNNILIFSPSDIFTKYISNVLPELGEENTKTTTFTDFLSMYLKEIKIIEDYSLYIERIYNSDYDHNIEIKQSKKIIEYADEFINFYLNDLVFLHGLSLKNKTFSSNSLTKYSKEKCNNLNVKEKINKIFDRMNGFINLKKKEDKIKIKDMLYSFLNHSINIIDIYNEFIDYINSKYKHNLNKINNDKISYEDANILLYLKLELFGYPSDINIKQVVIDEAQDYSLLQYNIMKKIFYKASYTIVGDVNQTINIYNKYNSLEELNIIFDTHKYLKLTKTYRSSKEIIEYSNKILGLNNVCSIQKYNSISIKDINTSNPYDELLKDLECLSKVAIITKNRNSALKLYLLLSKDNIKSMIYDDLFNNNEDIVIVPSYYSKGLEFENVIIYNESNQTYNDKEKYLFYTVCTRSQSRLIIYNK